MAERDFCSDTAFVELCHKMLDSSCGTGSIQWPNDTAVADWLASLHEDYGAVHPFVSLTICIAGTFMNILMIIVLTRPQMLTPINVILACIAACDIEVMLSYVLFVCHFLIQAAYRCEPNDFSLGWAKFMLFHAHGSVVFHSTSIWLTVALAQFRCLSLRKATAHADWINPAQTMGVALASLVVVLLINCPNFLTFEIKEVPAMAILPCVAGDSRFLMWANNTYPKAMLGDEDFLWNASLHYFEPCSTVSPITSNCALKKATFWSLGLLFKVVPCILLTVFICVLLHVLRDVRERRKKLGKVLRGKRLPIDHTTPMLIGVLGIFLITELPQGVMLVLTGIFTPGFHRDIYQNLGDVMDLLSLLNSATNFVIYCTMSQKFRQVFCETILPRRAYEALPMGKEKRDSMSRLTPYLVKNPRPSLFKGMFLSVENGPIDLCSTPRPSVSMPSRASSFDIKTADSLSVPGPSCEVML